MSDEAPSPYWSLIDYLDQSAWWKPRDAEPIQLEAMESSHRRHLLAYLRRHADAAAQSYVNEAFAFAAMCRGDMATYYAEHEAERAIDETVDPVAWLEQTPLVTRLREMTDADDALASIGPEWWEN